MSTLDYHADENRNFFSRPMQMLGEIHWHLLRATHFEKEQQSVKGGSLVDILEEMAHSGREFIGDEIHWWVFNKETDLEKLEEEVRRALDAAHVLKKDSEALGSKEPGTLSDLHELLKRFADDHSKEIDALHRFVLWLASRDRLAPAILWTYRVWGSTKRANRELGFDVSEAQPSAAKIKEMASIVLGFLSEGHPVESVAESELSSEMYDSGDFEGEEIHVDETRLIRRASGLAFFECAEYFECIRHSLRNVLLDITKFTKEADFANHDDFWQAFIEKATRTPKAETQLWDFKETLTMWHVNKEPERTKARVTFGEEVAAFANARGGVLIIGVTDKREIVGVGSGRELENRLKDAADVLPKYIDYPRHVWELRQIVIPGKDSTSTVCLVVVVSQACEPVAVHDGERSYTFPVRRETGLARVRRDEILRAKGDVKTDNLRFLGEVYRFVYRSARPSWPQQSGAYTAPSSETIPPFPSEWTGYRFEAGKDFWGKPFSKSGTVRIFQGGGWQGIHEFPATMNGCSSGVFMIRWRSAHPDTPVESSLRSYNAVTAVDTKPAQGFGYMSGSNCEQPMFKFPDEPNHHGGTLVDVYYELKFWQAAP
jgi:Putative DNA-binding domain